MVCRMVLVAFLCYLAKSDAACAVNAVQGKGVTPAQAQVIVDKHNALRLQVAQGNLTGQPKASNMRKMVWDNTLAALAQNLTDTCTFAHIRFTDPRWSVGQNLYSSFSGAVQSTVDWNAAIQAWFNENTVYTYSTTYNRNAGHYTQVVNAESYAVGCGFTNYYDPDNKRYARLYACNYGPGGNIMNVAPYKTGKGCETLC